MCACLRLPFFFSVVQDVVFFSFAFVCFVISSLFTFFLFLDSVISLNCCRFCDYLKLLSAHLLLCFFFFVTRRSSPFSFFRNSKTGGDVEDMPVPAVSLSRCCCCCFFFFFYLFFVLFFLFGARLFVTTITVMVIKASRDTDRHFLLPCKWKDVVSHAKTGFAATRGPKANRCYPVMWSEPVFCFMCIHPFFLLSLFSPTNYLNYIYI